uniref:NADH-ubiquinone oxidoreductase chain 2 n=1 Tax=Pselaphinae sp. 12 EF-2015 TaxID=1756871 RepID=A0A0S2M8E4_9COLE|nr:NADH deshydrogenase subunit 2 [Pselaphinae sp. 12 EF-2015]
MISTLISISSNSWFGMWLGLEINLLSIIPLMNNMNNSYSSESSMKYFIVQALSSTIILMMMILFMKFNYITNILNNSMNMIFNSALLTKMGSAPFHFWFPEVMEGLNWMNCFIMLSWQKITPMILLNYSLNNMNFIIIIIIISLMISGIMGLNQISMRKILTYSSINHISWMISSILFMETLWIIYLMIYFFIIFNVIYMLNLYKIFFINQLFIYSLNLKNFLFFSMNFLSLAGLPPFIGFFPKWLIIQMLINNNFKMLSLIMIILTLISMFFYIRLMYSSLNLNIDNINFIFNEFKLNSFFSFLNFLNLSSLIICTLMFSFI